MNSRNKLAAGILAAVFAMMPLVSCQEDYGEPDPFIDVPEADITVDYSGLNSAGKIPGVEIGSNISWAITAYPDWVTPSRLASDRGRFHIYFVCDENLTGDDRTGTVTVAGAGIEKSFRIIQSLKIETLELSQTEFSVGGDGRLPSGQIPSFYILEVNSKWTVDAPEWITPSLEEGEAGKYISVSLDVAVNDSRSARTGDVVFTAGSRSETVKVRQAVDGIDLGESIVSVDRYGYRDDSSEATLSVDSEQPWTAAPSASWIEVSPSSGNGGTVENVTITVLSENTDAKVRSGYVTFTNSNGITASVEVRQSTTAYEDDNLFFKDDFSWLSPYIEQYNAKNSKPVGDAVGSGDEGANAPNVYASGTWSIFEAFVTEFTERGYVDIRHIDGTYECLYMQDAYLKMGKGDYHTGLKLPVVEEMPEGGNALLIFDWCAQMTGSGNIDKLTLTVETENGGTVVTQMPIGPDQVKGELKWQTVTVRLENLGASSVISIRPTQMWLEKGESPNQQRWYIDNIRIERAN